jgi:hypothetical protein
MRKGFNLLLLLLLLLCFALSGCTTNYETKDESSELILISDEMIENLSTTKTVVVKNLGNELTKTITDVNEIEKIIDIISQATNVVGDITYEGARYNLEMYNTDNQLIDVVEIFNQNIEFKSDIILYLEKSYINDP